MTPAMRTVIYPVKDLLQAKALYGPLLGVALSMDEAYYVQFTAGDQEIGLDPHGYGKGMTGPVGYWHVADVEDSVDRLLDAGANVRRPISDVGGGRRIATVSDPDGNIIGLLQAAP